jgi:hypothetical protein
MGNLNFSPGETSGKEAVSAPPVGDPAGSPGSSPPVSQLTSRVMPQLGRVTKNGWWLLGGVLLVFIGSLLPGRRRALAGSSRSRPIPVVAAWSFSCCWRSAPSWPRGRS